MRSMEKNFLIRKKKRKQDQRERKEEYRQHQMHKDGTMADLYLLFNHRMTDSQAEQARQELGVRNIHVPPTGISRLWSDIPPEPENLREILVPVFSWIDTTLRPGDFLLVQGDFGACHLVLEHVTGSGIIPVYSTTRREAQEQHLGDGTVHLLHTFRHVRFRIYGR